MKDFFVSYAKDNRDWAEWIAWQLENHGYTTVLDVWDFPKGSDFAQEMTDAHRNTKRTIAVLSPAYLNSMFAMAEWNARFTGDGLGKRRLLIPVMVSPCELPGLMRSRLFIDLTTLDEQKARTELLASLPEGTKPVSAALPSKTRPGRMPLSAPRFPGKNPVGHASPVTDYSHLVELANHEQFIGTGEELYSIAFSRDNKWLAAGSEKKVLLWDRIGTPHPLGPQEPKPLDKHESFVYSVAFSSDSRFLATGCEDHVVRVWDVAEQTLVWEKSQHKDAVYAVAFSHDGKLLASGSYDRSVKVWDVKSGQLRFSYDHSLENIGRITSVAFAPDDKTIAFGSLDDKVRLWEPGEDRARVFEGHSSSVEAVAFSPKGDLLASCGLDKSVRLWDVANGEDKWKDKKRQHEYLVRSVAFSPDGATLASAGWDKTVKLWETETGKIRQSLPFDQDKPWHKDWIWSVAFSPDGMLLASSGSDGSVIVWRVDTMGMMVD